MSSAHMFASVAPAVIVVVIIVEGLEVVGGSGAERTLEVFWLLNLRLH